MPKERLTAARRYIGGLLLATALLQSGCGKNQDQDNPAGPTSSVAPAVTSAAKAVAGASTAPAIALSEALETISWQDAAAHMDQEVFAVGRVDKIGLSRTGHVFLNFDKKDRGSLTVFINKDKVKSFPQSPNDLYKGKTIKVHGFVYDHGGTPNISANGPEDISIVSEGAPATAPAASSPAWQLPADGTITLGTYNVLNLFDAYDDPYMADSPADEKPRQQVEALARSIRALNADVLALEEVENRGVLQRFCQAFLRDMGYEVVEFEGNDNRGIDVSLLSRIPVGPVTSHRHLRFPDPQGHPMRFRRDLLEVRLQPPGGPEFEVFIVHLKSKGGDADGGADTRMGEAREVRSILDDVLKRNPAEPFVLCGDFNDTVDSPPVKTILGTDGNALQTFVSDLPADGRISFNQPPFLSMIDFVFASPAMAARYVPASYRIVTGGSPETTGSDHNPVVVKFKIR